jgi:hypothetical protein
MRLFIGYYRITRQYRCFRQCSSCGQTLLFNQGYCARKSHSDKPLHNRVDLYAPHSRKHNPEKILVPLVDRLEIFGTQSGKRINGIARLPERSDLHPVGFVRIGVY